MKPFTHDVIIIGQGLAGSVLSETLQQRGKRVLLIDAPRDGRASWVASGIVNPIVLRRTLPSWRASELLAIAGAFYRELEQRYEASFWHPMPLVVLFPTAQEAGIWHLRMKDPEIGRMLSNEPVNEPGIALLPQRFGYGVVRRCAWLDTKRFLTLHRTRWQAAGNLVEMVVKKEDLVPIQGGVQINEYSAPLVVDCSGPFAQLAGLVPVRGEGLTIRIPGLELRSMVHRGAFFVPQGGDVYRVGSTFAWDDVWSGPSDRGKESLQDRLGRMWSGEVEIMDHWAGVRPAAKDRRPILGRVDERTAVLNGFGSRGVLLAPWCADHLAAHLFDGAALDAEVDAARFN